MFARLQEKQRVRLKLSYPAGQTLALTVIIFALLVTLAEGLARTTLVQAHVPFQAYGTNHIQFEIQMRNLEQYVAQNSSPDCFILGTSQALRSINPQVFAQAFKEDSGEEIRCYNFSIVGSSLISTRLFTQMLIDRYHPKLIILGTSFLDYIPSNETLPDPRFEDNDWLAYKLGQPTLEGWIVDHSYAFRLLLLFSYSAPNGLHFGEVSKEIKKWNSQIGADGYGYSDEVIDVLQAIPSAFWKNFLKQFGEYKTAPWSLDGLEKILQIARQSKTQIIIVEMPYHPSLIQPEDSSGHVHPDKAKLENFVLDTNADIQNIARQSAVLFWPTSELNIFPNDGWHDRYHLNYYGGEIFSQWLARQVAQAVADGQITGLAAQK